MTVVDLGQAPPIATPAARRGAAGPVRPFDLGAYNTLRVLANTFFDLQDARIRIENRASRAPVLLKYVDAFEEHVDKKTGKISLQHPKLREAEHKMELQLVRQYRKTVPPGVIAWQKAQRGIGEPLLARLLGQLGHPRIAIPQRWEGSGADRHLVEDPAYERTQAQLRAYCGHGDPKRVKFKGMTAEDAFRLGNPKCKTLVHLLAEACMKQPGTPVSTLLDPDHAYGDPQDRSVGAEGSSVTNVHRWCGHQNGSGVGGSPAAVLDRPSTVNGDHPHSDLHSGPVSVDDTSLTGSDQWVTDPQNPNVASGGTPRYRLVYEQRRLTTVRRLHDGPCVRCGPSGHPAGDGSPWSAQHQQADALRIVGETILNDLWAAAAQ